MQQERLFLLLLCFLLVFVATEAKRSVNNVTCVDADSLVFCSQLNGHRVAPNRFFNLRDISEADTTALNFVQQYSQLSDVMDPILYNGSKPCLNTLKQFACNNYLQSCETIFILGEVPLFPCKFSCQQTVNCFPDYAKNSTTGPDPCSLFFDILCSHASTLKLSLPILLLLIFLSSFLF